MIQQCSASTAGRLDIVNISVRMTGNVESAEKRDMLQSHPSVNTMSIHQLWRCDSFSRKVSSAIQLLSMSSQRVWREHTSAEHVYQMTKAIRAGDLEAAKKTREEGTALDAKRIGHTVRDPQGWHKEKETVMEEIVSAKVEQIPKVKAKLENSNSSTIFAEGTFDMQWGTGLDVDATLHTDH